MPVDVIYRCVMSRTLDFPRDLKVPQLHGLKPLDTVHVNVVAEIREGISKDTSMIWNAMGSTLRVFARDINDMCQLNTLDSYTIQNVKQF